MTFPARLPIPDAVVKIATKLEAAGYETWCVGGAVRDNLLGLENHDFDLTTAAPPAEIQRLFQRTRRTKSPRFARTSVLTAGMPWSSSGCP